jgi:hypothetical protein
VRAGRQVGTCRRRSPTLHSSARPTPHGAFEETRRAATLREGIAGVGQ